MTDRQEPSRPPSDKAYGSIEAFLDGERVDPAALKDALGHAEARDHFIDLLLLREALGEVSAAAPGVAMVRHRPSRVKWLMAAAATALVSLTVGYAAGQRVVASEPAVVEVFLPMEQGASAPAPTRSIAFEPGVNWTDLPGGQ